MSGMSRIDGAEMRRRWSNKTNADFTGEVKVTRTYPAEDYERECDFSDCEDIIFWNGAWPEKRQEDYLMSIKRSGGHVSLPANVRVEVIDGKVKFSSAGGRAPPPSRVSDYARSTADSGYSGSGRSNAGGNYLPSPPRDAAAFMRGGPAPSSYMSAAGIPPPRSNVGYGDDTRDDCSIAPSESISSVGSRGQFSRRATHDF